MGVVLFVIGMVVLVLFAGMAVSALNQDRGEVEMSREDDA